MRLILLLTALFLSACAGSYGYMNATVPDPKTGKWVEIHYSPYYEFEHRSDDQKVIARMVITLGGERVPKGHKFTGTFSEDLDAAHRDGILEWVWEVYFINTSEEKVQVTAKSVMGSSDGAGSFEIDPAKFAITRPIISLSSAYGVESEVSYEYEYLGKSYRIEERAKRLTVEEVKAKYGGG